MVRRSEHKRPKDTIGRILASAPAGTVEITQTKKPRNLLTPWVSREKELKVVFHPDDTAAPQPSKSLPRPSKSLPRQPKSLSRPPLSSAPPSYATAVGSSTRGAEGGQNGGVSDPGITQASIMSGVGMAAMFCAKLAYEYYCPPEVKKEGEEKTWPWEK